MTLATVLLSFLPVLPPVAPDGSTTLFRVHLTRVSQDLYLMEDTCTDDGCYHARTRHCSEYPHGQLAILEYSEIYDVDNITFESGTVCDVVGISQ